MKPPEMAVFFEIYMTQFIILTFLTEVKLSLFKFFV